MKNLILLLSLFVSTLVVAQGPRQSYHDLLKTYYKNTVSTIQPTALQKKILKNEQVYILDTREDSEHIVSSIKGSIKVGYDMFYIKYTNSYDKNSTIVVYCTIGVRSENIGEKLIKDGFKNVYNLYGGLIYWKNQGYPVIDSKGVNTKNIHVYSKECGKWLRKGTPIY